MGDMGSVGEAAASTDSRRVVQFDRRSPGLPWLIGVLVIPLLLAAIGYGAFDRPPFVNGPTGALPSLVPSNSSGAPKFSLAPLSISRNANSITLSGEFPDDSAKVALMNALKGSLAPGVNVVDQIQINPAVDALDFSNAGLLFKLSAAMIDFNLTVNGDIVTLAGTAVSMDQKNAIDRAAVHTWSGLNVVDNIAVKGLIPPPGPPGPVPPGLPPADPCADVQSAINAATGGPIFFGSDGFSLTPADDQILTQVADKLKACPNARATLNGYTDNSGAEGINIPLSAQRAGTVADFLVAHGVARDHLAVKGKGSVNPIASNDTPDGRAKNRRVEIVVS